MKNLKIHKNFDQYLSPFINLHQKLITLKRQILKDTKTSKNLLV